MTTHTAASGYERSDQQTAPDSRAALPNGEEDMADANAGFLTPADFFGEDAAAKWSAAIDAAHAFAQASGCEAGYNVIAWLSERSDALAKAQLAPRKPRPPFVQIRNPVSGYWHKLDTNNGRIVATKRGGRWPDVPQAHGESA